MLNPTFRLLPAIMLPFLAAINCEPPPSTNYGTPLAPPLTSYGGAANINADNHHNHHDFGEPKAYEFGYQVKDDYSGNNYKRQETSDGNQVTGEYRVALPDGRTQIVTYYADWQTGFHADVRYEGTASYPDQQGYGGGYNHQPYNQQSYNQPQYNQQPSNQYGAPNFGTSGGGGYQGGYQNGGATSTVHIKDYSNGGTPYNVGNNYNNQYSSGQGYDSYTHAASFGNQAKPNTAYGAP